MPEMRRVLCINNKGGGIATVMEHALGLCAADLTRLLHSWDVALASLSNLETFLGSWCKINIALKNMASCAHQAVQATAVQPGVSGSSDVEAVKCSMYVMHGTQLASVCSGSWAPHCCAFIASVATAAAIMHPAGVSRAERLLQILSDNVYDHLVLAGTCFGLAEAVLSKCAAGATRPQGLQQEHACRLWCAGLAHKAAGRADAGSGGADEAEGDALSGECRECCYLVRTANAACLTRQGDEAACASALQVLLLLERCSW